MKINSDGMMGTFTLKFSKEKPYLIGIVRRIVGNFRSVPGHGFYAEDLVAKRHLKEKTHRLDLLAISLR